MTGTENGAPLVLIVDDQPADIKLLEVFLSSAHYHTISASDGRSALEQAAAKHPNVILLDIMMPNVDGFEVCRQLKANPELKDIPIIFLSAKDRIQDKVAGLELGAHDYLTKPFRLEELHARIRRVLQQQQEHARELEQFERYKANLMAVFQHELRNPLTVISSFTDILTKGENLTPEQQQSYLQHIAGGSESLRLLSDNLVALDMLERGVQPTLVPVDLAAVGRSLLEALAQLFAQKQQRLEVAWPEQPAVIEGEPSLLRQAIGALLANANKFTPEQGHIQVRLEVQGTDAVFTVKDDGPGMSPELVAQIMARVTTPGSLNPDRPGGLGLGLMLTHRVAHLHGGELTIDSTVGQGSEFRLLLPLLHSYDAGNAEII